MCQMSTKLPAKFHQNLLHTLDKIEAKHIPTHSNEKLSQILTLSPNVKIIAISLGNKYMPSLKQRSRDSLCNSMQMMCQTGNE